MSNRNELDDSEMACVCSRTDFVPTAADWRARSSRRLQVLQQIGSWLVLAALAALAGVGLVAVVGRQG